MSTRSGKRIHSSDLENVEMVSELQSERKTRNRRPKENCDEVANAKRNFVRRPFDNEIESSNDKTEIGAKSVRKSKRHTLKDLNVDAIDSEVTNDKIKTRKSRRFMKEEVESTNILIQETVKEKKKSKKKQKAAVENCENDLETVIMPKKKSSKKKNKKSNSFIVEDLVTGEKNVSFNKSTASIDSFHSAAGSPINDIIDNEATNNNKGTKKQKTKLSNFTLTVENEKVAKKKNKKAEREKVKKLSQSNKCFEASVGTTEAVDDKADTSVHSKISDASKSKKKKSKEKFFSNNDENKHIPKHDGTNYDDSNNYLETKLTEDLNNSNDISSNKIKSIGKTDDVDKLFHTNPVINITHANGMINHLDDTSPSNNSSKKRRKSIKISTFNEMGTSFTTLNTSSSEITHNLTIESNIKDKRNLGQTNNLQNSRKSVSKDTTYEKIDLSGTSMNNTYDKHDRSYNVTCTGREPDNNNSSSRRKSSIKNTTFDKIEDNAKQRDTTFEKEPSVGHNEISSAVRLSSASRKSLPQSQVSAVLNGTYDKNNTTTLNSKLDEPQLDATFEYEDGNKSKTCRPTSLISSDNADDMTSDMSEDCSPISITSDESGSENILNTTPVLIESSMDESQMYCSKFSKTVTPLKGGADQVKTTPDKIIVPENNKTPLKRDGTYTELRQTPLKHHQGTLTEESKLEAICAAPTTPLKREGTFTRDSPPMSPRVADGSPTCGGSTPSPGRTPFPVSKSGSKARSALNVTHSVEKSTRRSSSAAGAPRLTRVMFCSPDRNPAAAGIARGTVIKSNLKGSNKSFVFDDSVSESRGARKRSRTLGAGPGGAKRARLAPGLPPAPRPRALSAKARLQDSDTNKGDAPPAESGAEAGPPRSRLPNFAALHRKQFDRMESLEQCQERKARRARRLLTPTATNHVEKTGAIESAAVPQSDVTKIPETPESKDAEKKNLNYSRFGFKLNPDVNPFSVPTKTDVRPKANIGKSMGLKRHVPLPSLAGNTLRKEVARQAVMRERSFTDRRDVTRKENRTVIKGVRLNRRFELQMKMRNID